MVWDKVEVIQKYGRTCVDCALQDVEGDGHRGTHSALALIVTVTIAYRRNEHVRL